MLSREEVLKIAHLARLNLAEEEVISYQQRLSRVLDYIRDLSELETSKDAFVRHIPKDAVAFRADRPIAFQNASGILLNSPALEGNSFLLPQIVEHT